MGAARAVRTMAYHRPGVQFSTHPGWKRRVGVDALAARRKGRVSERRSGFRAAARALTAFPAVPHSPSHSTRQRTSRRVGIRRLGKLSPVLTAVAAFGFGLVCYVYLTLPDVRSLATANPTSTAFMEMRLREATAKGLKPRTAYQWVPYSRISPNLKRAVLVAEDSAFWDHEGVDVEQIRKSIEDSMARRQAPRGASTITQQLAKNLYLSPSYDPLRKIKELIIARRLEVALTKTRILELYLNVIEWGDRVWGAEAAARAYFGVAASSLSRQQSALLAGAIVNPRLLTPAHPTRRLLRRQQIILARMGSVEGPAPSAATSPALERHAEPRAPAPPRFPLTVDEEEAQDSQAPAELAPAAPADESPPA